MIEAAAIVSAIIGHWEDFAIITALLFFNAALEFWQDRKASNALAALKKGLAPEATALRDGKWQTLQAATLVPGDIVKIRLGVIVPADLRLVGGDYASIDQSALTGESLPVAKKVGDEAYSGSIVKQGEMKGVVIATGTNTFFGRTAKLVAGAGAVSHAQKAMFQIGNFLIVVAVALALDHGRRQGLSRHRHRRRLGAEGRARHPAVRADPARRVDPGGDAGGVLDHHGARRACAVEAEGDRLASCRRSRRWRASTSCAPTRPGTLTKNQLDARRPDPVRRQEPAGCASWPRRSPRRSRTATPSTPR